MPCATSKVSPTFGQPSDAVDATLLEHRHVRPGVQKTVAKHDIALGNQTVQAAKQAQFALTLACVAADADIRSRAAGAFGKLARLVLDMKVLAEADAKSLPKNLGQLVKTRTI